MPIEPQIQIAEVDPGQPPLSRAAVELTPALRFRFHAKNARGKVIEQLKADKTIPLLDQEYILARIAEIPAEHEILDLAVIGNPHKAGFNFSVTVCEL